MELLKIKVSEEFAKVGLTEETLKLSQTLDIHIAIEQRKRLDEHLRRRGA